MPLPNDQKIDEWASQFSSPEDEKLAKSLASNLLTVSSDKFIQSMEELIRKSVADCDGSVGIYIETERRHQIHKETGTRKPDRLFKESSGRRKRATGPSPPIFRRQNNPMNEVGSEGILAQLATEISRQNSDSVCINPGPDRIRKSGSQVRLFLLLTDFIGSGDRVFSYLESAWRLKSVRSWWSRRSRCGMRFEILAYSATENGLERVKSHPCQPNVKLIASCPTIFGRFNPKKCAQMIDLCNRHTENDAFEYRLGYSESGALIAFHHGIPNNTPSIFWNKSKNWKPLFSERVTSSIRHTFSSDSHAQYRNAATLNALGVAPSKLESISELPFASVTELLVMASLRRSPRTLFAISGRSGIDIFQTQEILDSLETRRFVNDSHRLTERGKKYLSELTTEKVKELPIFNTTQYYPTQLRAPKEPS